MTKKSEIRHLTIKEILNVLEEEEQDGGLHVYFRQQVISHNPFPYPFRSENTGILIFTRGRVKIQIDLKTYIAGVNDIVFLDSQSILQVMEVIEDVQCVSVSFTDEFALKNIQNYSDVNVLRLFAEKKITVFHLPAPKRDLFIQLIEHLYRLNRGQEKYYRKERIMHFFNVLALELMGIVREEIEKLDLKTSRKKILIDQFLKHLKMHARKERDVQFYADKLCVTPDYLTRVIKQASDLTAREVIEEAVVMEARDLLMDHNLSIGRIAEILNFSDQSFFGKYFKKKMKVSPNAFRNQNHG